MATGADMPPIFRTLIGKVFKSSYDGSTLDAAGCVNYCVKKVFGRSAGTTAKVMITYFTGKSHIGAVIKYGAVEKSAAKAGDIVICDKYDGTNSHVMMIAANGSYNVLEATSANGIRYKADYSSMCSKATHWVRINSGNVITTGTAASATSGSSATKQGLKYYSPYGKSLTKDEQKVNAVWIATYLKAKGWGLGGICGVLGNMQSESSINPNRPQACYNSTYPSKCNAFGLIQWTGTRYKNLIKYCNSRGISNFTTNDDNPMGNMALQLDFLDLDNSSDPTYGKNYYKSKNWKASHYWSWDQFKKLDVSQSAYAAECFYYASERSAANNAGSRPQNATNWANYLTGQNLSNPLSGGTSGGGASSSGGGTGVDGIYSGNQSAVGEDYSYLLAGGLPLTSVDVYAGMMNIVLSQIESSENITLSVAGIKAPIGYLRDLNHGGQFKFIIPESRTESVAATYSQIDIPGRSSMIQAYSSTNALARNIALDIVAGEGLYASNTCLDDIEKDLRFLNSLVYPDYSKSLVNPPSVVLLYTGPNSVMKGVVTSVEVTKKAPFAADGRAMNYTVSFTVTQVSDNPADYNDVREGLSIAY